jgi:hypothetical protein
MFFIPRALSGGICALMQRGLYLLRRSLGVF